jgi:hypothetical protein
MISYSGCNIYQNGTLTLDAPAYFLLNLTNPLFTSAVNNTVWTPVLNAISLDAGVNTTIYSGTPASSSVTDSFIAPVPSYLDYNGHLVDATNSSYTLGYISSNGTFIRETPLMETFNVTDSQILLPDGYSYNLTAPLPTISIYKLDASGYCNNGTAGELKCMNFIIQSNSNANQMLLLDNVEYTIYTATGTMSLPAGNYTSVTVHGHGYIVDVTTGSATWMPDGSIDAGTTNVTFTESSY